MSGSPIEIHWMLDVLSDCEKFCFKNGMEAAAVALSNVQISLVKEIEKKSSDFGIEDKIKLH